VSFVLLKPHTSATCQELWITLLPPGSSLPPGTAPTFQTHRASGQKGDFSFPDFTVKVPHYWCY